MNRDDEQRKLRDELLQLLRLQSNYPVLPVTTLLHQGFLNMNSRNQRSNQSVGLQTSLNLAAALSPALLSQSLSRGSNQSVIDALALAEILSNQLPSYSNRLAHQIPRLPPTYPLTSALRPMMALPSSSSIFATSRSVTSTATPSLAASATTDSRNAVDEIGKRDPVHAFPSRLHEILSNPEYAEYISWLPHGRAWRVLDKTQFEKKVIPHHFRHARYASFMRQVNGWGFKRITDGPDHNAYYHENFLRDYPQLCWKIQRSSDSMAEESVAKKKLKERRTVSLLKPPERDGNNADGKNGV